MSQVQRISIPNTQKIDFVSEVNGHQYSISVGLPFGPAPENGYRVLYLLDGYAYFASALEAVRGNGNAPDVVVVGLGYPDDDAFVSSVVERHAPLPAIFGKAPFSPMIAFSLERAYDLSLPASDEVLAAISLPGMLVHKAKNVGGLDDFLKTIETEVKPRVAAMVSIDSSSQAIFGHSLGGLAVIHALFVEPNVFRTFIAASPSIWWNHKVVLANEARFSAAVGNGTASPRVLITMGSDEDDVVPPALAAKLGMDPAELEAKMEERRIRDGGMVENGRALTRRLQALRGSGDFQVEDYAVFPKQGHGISPWPALGRAIAFAFPQ